MIQDIAVKTVEGFLNNQIPLSVGLAKQASAYELNGDQIQRCIEASNSICYLKMLQLGTDRTVEFPVAEYNDVLSHVAVPDMDKSASVTPAKAVSVFSKPSLNMGAFEKAANVTDYYDSLPEHTKSIMLLKEAQTNKRAIEELEVQSNILSEKLVKVAKEVSKDPQGLNKIASLSEEHDFKRLSVLVSGEVKPFRNLSDMGIFKEANMSSARSLCSLYKEAQELMTEMVERREMAKCAETMIQKTAAKMNTTKVQPTAGVSNKGLFSASSVEKNVGQVAAKGGKIPDYIGKGTSFTANKVVGAIAAAPKAVAKAAFKHAGVIAGAGFDAAAYSPGIDKTTGRPNDVWAALNS